MIRRLKEWLRAKLFEQDLMKELQSVRSYLQNIDSRMRLLEQRQRELSRAAETFSDLIAALATSTAHTGILTENIASRFGGVKEFQEHE